MEFIKIGKNAKNNFEIIEQADENDLWFHLADYTSAHGILHHQHITNENIHLIAELIKNKKKECKGKKVKVEYLPVKFVKKTKITGMVELLEKPKYVYL